MPTEVQIISGLISVAAIIVMLWIGIPKITRKVESLEPAVLSMATLESFHLYQRSVAAKVALSVQAQADANVAIEQLAKLRATLNASPIAV